MRRLKLNFPYAGQQALGIDLICLVLGLLVFAGVLYQFMRTSEAVNYWDVRVEGLIKKQQPNRSNQIRFKSRDREISQEIRQEIKAANIILGQINLPWDVLFDSIGHAASKDIALLSLQPNASSQSIKISGEARNMSVLLDFVEAIEREVVFTNAYLVNYKIKQDSPQQPIIFLLTTSWNSH